MNSEDWHSLGEKVAGIASKYPESQAHRDMVLWIIEGAGHCLQKPVADYLEQGISIPIGTDQFLDTTSQMALETAARTIRANSPDWDAFIRGLGGDEEGEATENKQESAIEEVQFHEDWHELWGTAAETFHNYIDIHRVLNEQICEEICLAIEQMDRQTLIAALGRYLDEVLLKDINTAFVQGKIQSVLAALKREEPEWIALRGQMRLYGFEIEEPVVEALFPLTEGSNQRKFWDLYFNGNADFTEDQQLEIAGIMSTTEGPWDDGSLLEGCIVRWEDKLNGSIAIIGNSHHYIQLVQTK